MGGIFKNPTVSDRRASYGQRRYLASKKTDRETKNVKHEQNIQIQARDWFVGMFPGEHFISDTGAGAFNSEWAKEQHNRQQSHKREPDVKILAARREYHGLVIELKADGVNLKKKRDGTKIRVRKDKRGRIIERDYKIRMKGDWSNLHIEEQAKVLADYVTKGYYGHFAVGLEAFKKICCWYFNVPYEPPIENAELF